MVRRSLILILSAVLLFQVVLVFNRWRSKGTIVSIEVNERLPFMVEGWHLPLEGTGEAESPCTVAFLCAASCPFCEEMATDYAVNLHDNTPLALKPVWLMVGDPTATHEWAEKTGLPDSRVFHLSPLRRTWPARVVSGDVWFTPTRLILTPDLIVRDARPGDELLTEEQLDEFCRRGGIAPRSLEELREQITLEQKGK